jgi:thiol-disulfide isomerase/thioredoxin
MGHPQGLTFSVTTGNVGALRRTAEFPPELPTPGEADPNTLWVQSNAAIAGGSSGGPLCDSQGRVIGINSWLAVRENFAFAVHVGHLRELMKAAPDKIARLPGDRPVGELDNPLATLEPRIQAMWQEFLQADNEFRLQLLRARTPQEQQELLKTRSPRPKYAERLLKIADTERKTTTGFQALFLACQMHVPGGDDGPLKQAAQRLGEDHLTDRGLHLLFRQLAASGHVAATALLTKALEQSPHRQVQGAACYFLANCLLAQRTPEKNAEALRLLERCAKDFADVKVDAGTLGELALRDGFRAKYLSVGSKALDIEGPDAEGKPLKLSDFRGNVVLIDFFADWCPYCVAMYPHEQQLVKRYAGKPFVLLGVNGDGPDTLRQITAAGKVTWRCWNDGQNGPIAQRWQIDGTYPTLFLLDAEGVIRQIFIGRPMPERQLDEAIDKLLAEAEKAAAKKENGGR